MDKASPGTSEVIVDPAATYAPFPTFTGATKLELQPIKTPSSILVKCLLKPS